jgi:hypothetical protein
MNKDSVFSDTGAVLGKAMSINMHIDAVRELISPKLQTNSII